MTTKIITRLFADEKGAEFAARKLRFKNFPNRAYRVVSGADDAAARLESAGVHESAISGYAKGLADGGAALVIHATYKPLGAARIAREMLANRAVVDVAGAIEEHSVPTPIDRAPSVLKDHPRLVTLPPEYGEGPQGPVTGNLGMRMVKPARTKRTAMAGGRYMSRMFWPMPLLKRNRTARSAMSSGRYMSRAFWPMPLLTSKSRRKSVIRDGSLPLSHAMGWSTVSSQ